jgi:hypothetical protein
MREEGIELLRVSERGTQLVWRERSSAATNLVVLDQGRGFNCGKVLLLTRIYL